MENLTDRAAYLLGLANGMNLDAGKSENKLLMETLKLIEELASEITVLDSDTKELGDYIEELDRDLGEAETAVYSDEECCCDECRGVAEDDEDAEALEELTDEDAEEPSYSCECDEEGHVHFDCPNCGKLVSLTLDDLDDENELKCKFCGEPFFSDLEEDAKDGKKDKKKKKHKK